MFLADGPHPNSRSQRPKGGSSVVPVPTRLSFLQSTVAALRDDEEQLVMPPVLRRRALLMLQGLAAEAVRRGYEVRQVRSYYSRREGGVDVVVDGFAYTVTVRQEFPQSTNPERSERLVIELDHGRSDRPGRWRDRKARVLEDALGVILGEIEARALDDAQSRGRRRRPGRSVRFAGGRPWRRRRSEPFGINSWRYFVRRPDAGRRPPCSVPTVMLLNVVLPNRAAPWTSRLWNRPDAGWSGHVNSCR
jgi:hypothetical protein